ncbi:hypothetical protein MBLNU230_g5873t1 [Neophaeotheca triangularis]
MLLQRLAFQEVAARFSQPAVSHSFASCQLADQSGDVDGRTMVQSSVSDSGTALNQIAPRLPSRRPIDKRWDRSRGIVFSGNRRTALRDYRSSPTQAIFSSPSEPASSRRLYSSRSQPPPKPNFGGSARSSVKSHARETMGPSLKEFGGRRAGEDLNREKEYLEGQQAIKELKQIKSEKHGLEKQLAASEEKVREWNRDYKSLKKEHDEERRQWEVDTKRQFLEQKTRAGEELEEHVARAVERTARPLREKLEIERNRDVAAEETARAEMQRASLAMNRVEPLEAENDALRERMQRFNTEREDGVRAMQSQYDEEIRLIKAKYSHDIRIAENEAVARPQRRSNYAAYRKIYGNLQKELSLLSIDNNLLTSSSRDIVKYWEGAQQSFERFCEEQKASWLLRRHVPIVKEVKKYLADNLQRAEKALQASRDLTRGVVQAYQQFSGVAHDHRNLIRWLRLRNRGDYNELSYAANIQGVSKPWARLMELALSQVNSKKINSFFRDWAKNLGRLRDLDELIAIRHEDIGAKAVFLETDSDKQTDFMVQKIQVKIGEQALGAQSRKRVSQSLTIIGDARAATVENKFVHESFVRRTALVKKSLGQADEEEKRYDQAIERLIAEKRKEVVESMRQYFQVDKTASPVSSLSSRLSSPRLRSRAAATSRPHREPRRAPYSGQRSLNFRPSAPMRAEHTFKLPGILLPKLEENITVNVAFLPNGFERSHEHLREDSFSIHHPGTVSFIDSSTRQLGDLKLLDSSNSDPTDSAENPPEMAQSSDSSTTTDKTENVADAEVSTPHEEHTPPTFQIPEDVFKGALRASPTTSAAYWKHTLYRGPEGQTPRYHYCTSYETAEIQAKKFLNEPVLGFDLEWETYAKLDSSSIKDNVSLVQIAAEDKICLFHIACFKGRTVDELMPPSLRLILESPTVVKAGVNVVGDANRLRKCFGIEMQGLFELSHLYKVVKYSEKEVHKVNRKPWSLAKQVEEILHLPLRKGEVRTSAWSKRLNVEQCLYAASDAYAGFRLFDALETKRKAMKPTPPRPAFYELHQPLVLGDGTKVMPKSGMKDKTAAASKGTEAEDEDDEEFFDAVETQDDADEVYSYAGVPLSGITYPSLPPLETLNINAEANNVNTLISSSAAAPSAPPKSSTPQRTIPSSPETAAAEAWLTTYRSDSSNPTITPANLRAYHLWHFQQKSVPEIAALLRETPLAQPTVANYVMTALSGTRLPFDGARMGEVLEFLPSSVRWRYKGVVRRAERSVA